MSKLVLSVRLLLGKQLTNSRAFLDCFITRAVRKVAKLTRVDGSKTMLTICEERGGGT